MFSPNSCVSDNHYILRGLSTRPNLIHHPHTLTSSSNTARTRQQPPEPSLVHLLRAGLEQAEEEVDFVNLDRHDEKGTASSVQECIKYIYSMVVRGISKVEREWWSESAIIWFRLAALGKM